MRIYSHGIIAYLLYLKGTKDQRKLAVFGGIAPDVILTIGYIFHFLGDSQIVESLHYLFHRSVLHTVTEIMHSIVISGTLFLGAFLFYKKAMPFFVGMIAHGIVDLFTHQGSGYNHFLPFPIGELNGIVSYTWVWFTVLEHLLVLLFFVWLFKKQIVGWSKKTIGLVK